MKRISEIILCAIIAMTVAACEKPDNNDGSTNNPPVTETPEDPGTEKPEDPGTEKPEDPEKPAEPSVNSYILNGEEHTFGSVAVSNFGEYLCIAASTAEDVASFDEMFEQDEYFYLAISPLLNGTEFDLMTETRLYTVMSTLAGAELESVAPEMKEEISKGVCTFTYENGVATASISIVLADGSTLAAKLSAEEVIVVNENTIAVNGDTKPIRSAFYLQEDDVTTLYLTAAGITYGSELEIAIYYAYLTFDETQCAGKTVSISEITGAGIVDNANEVHLSTGSTEVSGTVNISRSTGDPEHYTVVAHLDFNGTTLDIEYDGTAIDYNIEPEVVYEVSFDNVSYKIKEVTLDKTVGNDLWRVLVKSEGEDFTITMPSSDFDGNMKGFSQFQKNPDFKVTYGENVYNKSTGASGTVTVGIEGETIHVEFTNYDDLEVFYEGKFKTIE